MEEETIKMPFEYVLTTALISMAVAQREAKDVMPMINEDPDAEFLLKNWRFKKVWGQVVNGLDARMNMLFTPWAHRMIPQDSLTDIKRMLGEIVDELQQYTAILKVCLQKHLSYHDCVCEKIIAKMLVCGTMLMHANSVGKHIDRPTELLLMEVERYTPRAEYHHFTQAADLSKLLPQDEDFKYMEDMDIHNAFCVLADKIGYLAIKKFI